MKKYKQITDLEILKLGAIPYVVSGLYFGPFFDKFSINPAIEHELIEIISAFLLAYEIDYLNNQFELKLNHDDIKKISSKMTDAMIALSFKKDVQYKNSEKKKAYYNYQLEIVEIFLNNENRYITLAKTLNYFLTKHEKEIRLNFRFFFLAILNLIDDAIRDGLLDHSDFKRYTSSLKRRSKFSVFKYAEKGTYSRKRKIKSIIIEISYKNNIKIRFLDHDKGILKETIMFEGSGKWLDVVNFQFEFMKFKFGQKK